MTIGPRGDRTQPLSVGGDFSSGTLIANRYEIEEELGRGGMAIVLRVVDHKMGGNRCALKVLKPDLAVEIGADYAEEVLKRFKQEILLVRERLQHDNIVKVYEYHEAKHGKTELRFASMELVPGRSLDGELADRPTRMTPPELRSILIQMARALAFAHDRGVVHRDLKPANLLVFQKSGRWVVKLSDFGIAKVIAGTPLVSTTGPAPGTPRYAAPEQLQGKPVGTWTDVYQAGLVAYQLLHQSLERHWSDDQLSGKVSFPSWMPARVEAVLRRCLEHDPSRRYSGGAALLAALEEAWPGGDTTEPLPPPIPPRSVLRNPWIWLAIVAIVAALLVVWAAKRESGPPLHDAGIPPSSTATATPLPSRTTESPPDQQRRAERPATSTPTQVIVSVPTHPPSPTPRPTRRPPTSPPEESTPPAWQSSLAADLLNQLSPASMTLQTTSSRTVFYRGETIAFQVSTNWPGYLYLLVFSENDVATCIFPSEDDPESWIGAGTHAIPRNSDYEFPVQAPFGQDLVVAVLSPVELRLGDRITYTWQEVFKRLQLPRVKEVTRGIGVRTRPTVTPDLEWQTSAVAVTTRPR
jgi:serine/threonine-protein kinase